MVLTKKKSFIGNNTNNNKSKKINRVSQEGSGFPYSKKNKLSKEEFVELQNKVSEDQKYKKKID